MAKMSPVTHFELGYKDKQRIMKFYESAFGWKARDMGAQMGDYVLAQTTETDKDGMVQTPGNINGGFYKLGDDPLATAPSVVIQVDDISASLKAVEAGGGKKLGVLDQNGQRTMEPQMIPGVGRWMAIQDTEGNRLSLIQPPTENPR
jgi:predicted enzyme related to lactoylglutathione lyase